MVTLPAMPCACGALDDQPHGEEPELARLMQMDVDRLAVLLRRARRPCRDGPSDPCPSSRDRGRRPPRRPWRSASSISSTVPGLIIMPDCGKATISMSMKSRVFLARRHDAFDAPRPCTVSTSTWLRIWVVPRATDSATWRADWRAGSRPSFALHARAHCRSCRGACEPTSLTFHSMP